MASMESKSMDTPDETRTPDKTMVSVVHLGPATVARYNMVKIQVPALEALAAILAGIPVTLENIVPSELDLFPRQPIENEQENYPWHLQSKRDRTNAPLVGRHDAR